MSRFTDLIQGKKREAKKDFKKLKKDNSVHPEVLMEKKSEWRQLVRTHNRIRLQEAELQNKREEISNNKRFSADPFKFMREKVTKDKERKTLEPTDDIHTAEAFFRERYSDPKRTEKVKFPDFLDVPE